MRMILVFLLLFALSDAVMPQSLYSVKDTTNKFEITCATTVPDSVGAVLVAATSYWSGFLFTDIKIHVKVEWTVLGSNVQSSCQPALYYKNFKNAPRQDVMYPVALAEKLAGLDLNAPTDPDINLKINKDISWNCVVAGSPASDQSDLFTVFIHEIAHGIGFNSNFSVDGSVGYLIGSSLPTNFDVSVVDSALNSLVDTSIYTLNTQELKNALTSQKLYFDGKFSLAIGNNELYRLYAPATFNYGSSVNHLDEDLYPKGAENALMTPGFTLAEKIHEAGPAALSIIADLGWNDFLFSAARYSDVEDVNYVTDVVAYAAGFIDTSEILLHYSFDNFAHEVAVKMTATDSTGYFKANIPSYPFERVVSYYVTATDTSVNQIEVGDPIGYPSNFYSFSVAKDTIAPTLVHSVITSISEDTDTLLFSATITDNLGVDSAWVEYTFSSSVANPTIIRLAKSGTSLYSVRAALSFEEGDFFQYRIVAIDKSNSRNQVSTSGDQSNGFYGITVGAKSEAVTSIEVTFDDPETDRTLFALSGFTISQNEGFSSPSLNSAHPYENSSKDGEYLNITAMLANPVTLRSTEAYMEFDEIALLEPGESGTEWGDYEYWDYVIVEGSKNKIDWYAFEWEGYKTELYDEWLEVYYSDIETDENGKENSVAVPTEALYRHHTINLLGNKFLRKGDDVYIRFRMYTDAFENGWGWSIDNVEVQTAAVAVAAVATRKPITVAVMPGGCVKIVAEDEKILSVCLRNVLGQSVSASNASGDSQTVVLEKRLVPGIYMVTVSCVSGNTYSDKILVN